MQPLPFNGFVVEDEEDEDDIMSDDLSVKDPDASTRNKDDSARTGCEGLDVETGKVSSVGLRIYGLGGEANPEPEPHSGNDNVSAVRSAAQQQQQQQQQQQVCNPQCSQI
jgi:hypothetical protein